MAPASKTVHVIPRDGGWAVRREGATGTLHRTKREAMERARRVLKSLESGQIVVHRRDGAVSEHRTYGMPHVQDPPTSKSRLGRRNVEKAVNKVLLDRLKGDSARSRG